MKRLLWVASSLALASCQCGPAAACPNDLPSTSSCTSSVPAWDGGVSSIVVARCAPCHRPGNLNAPSLDTYLHVQAAAGPSLDQTYACLMPPGDAGSGFALTSQERHDLLQWLVCGAPNN